MKICVLVLGDEEIVLPSDLRDAEDLEFEFTLETRDEIWDGTRFLGGGYRVSGRSVELAKSATEDMYDGVVIGNNRGTGVSKAEQLPGAMRDRTLIVWNEYLPGIERPYADLGYTRFGQRHRFSDEPEVLTTQEFLRELVAQKRALAS